MREHGEREEDYCEACKGAGMEAKLYPNGHTELRCVYCLRTGIDPIIEDYGFNPKIEWKPKKGDVIFFKDMSESYIKNCMAMIRAKAWRPECLEYLEEEYYNRLTESEAGKILYA